MACSLKIELVEEEKLLSVNTVRKLSHSDLIFPVYTEIGPKLPYPKEIVIGSIYDYRCARIRIKNIIPWE